MCISVVDAKENILGRGSSTEADQSQSCGDAGKMHDVRGVWMSARCPVKICRWRSSNIRRAEGPLCTRPG